MRITPTFAAAAALLALGTPLAAQPLAPDVGDYKAQGSFTDQAGHVGQWHADGTLRGGRFSGTLAMEMLGSTRSVILVPAKAMVRGGTCVLSGENGRNRVELRGPCDDAAIGPGTLSGRIDGQALRGRFEGTMAAGPALRTVPAKSPERTPPVPPTGG